MSPSLPIAVTVPKLLKMIAHAPSGLKAKEVDDQ
jgi:hypothetical protein